MEQADQVARSGWLEFWTGYVSGWKRRWCLLRPSATKGITLIYSKAKEDEIPAGLVGYIKAVEETASDKENVAFKITAARTTHYFKAPSPDERRLWISEIKTLLAAEGRPTGLGPAPSLDDRKPSGINRADSPASDSEPHLVHSGSELSIGDAELDPPVNVDDVLGGNPPFVPALHFDRQIGKGGQATVWKALYHFLLSPRFAARWAGMVVAAKIALLGETGLGLGLTELGVTLTITHPNIVRLYGVFAQSAACVSLLEFCAGGSLDRAFPGMRKTDGALAAKVFTREGILEIMSGLCNGLAYLHSRNILHRDLKPENILLLDEGPIVASSVKIADFGLARFHKDGASTRDIGTELYIAPEVVKADSRNRYGASADMWAVGLILMELLARKRVTVAGRTKYFRKTIEADFQPAMLAFLSSTFDNFALHSGGHSAATLLLEGWRGLLAEAPAARPSACDIHRRMVFARHLTASWGRARGSVMGGSPGPAPLAPLQTFLPREAEDGVSPVVLAEYLAAVLACPLDLANSFCKNMADTRGRISCNTLRGVVLHLSNLAPDDSPTAPPAMTLKHVMTVLAIDAGFFHFVVDSMSELPGILFSDHGKKLASAEGRYLFRFSTTQPMELVLNVAPPGTSRRPIEVRLKWTPPTGISFLQPVTGHEECADCKKPFVGLAELAAHLTAVPPSGFTLRSLVKRGELDAQQPAVVPVPAIARSPSHGHISKHSEKSPDRKSSHKEKERSKSSKSLGATKDKERQHSPRALLKLHSKEEEEAFAKAAHDRVKEALHSKAYADTTASDAQREAAQQTKDAAALAAKLGNLGLAPK